MAGGGDLDAYSLEFTPTWVVALVCSIIVCISLGVERLLHSLGKFLKKKNQNPLFEALPKIKEELMLLGFISLLLSVFQNTISKICIHESWTNHMLPCNKSKLFSSKGNNEYCTKGKVPLLSTEALHHLHIFIFVLAIVHVTFCVLTIVFGGIKIRMWKQWEDSIVKDKYNTIKHLNKIIDVYPHLFIEHKLHISGRRSLAILGWLSSFFKQFHGSVTKSIYITLHLGFITVQFGFESCIMGQVWFIFPRLVIGVFIQVICSYSTLPLYAIVTRIGDSLNKAIFNERVQAGLDGWAEDARLRAAAANGSTQGFGCCPIWIRPIRISTMGDSSNKSIFDERLQEAQESRLRATAANGSTQGGAAHQGGSTEGSSTTVMGLMGEQPEPAQEIANEDAGDIEGSSTTVILLQ